MLPIINGSPTEWEHLYAAMKEAEKIKNRIFKDGKTIFSFDLQLFIKLTFAVDLCSVWENFISCSMR